MDVVGSLAMPYGMLCMMWTEYDPNICNKLISSQSHRMEI